MTEDTCCMVIRFSSEVKIQGEQSFLSDVLNGLWSLGWCQAAPRASRPRPGKPVFMAF